MCRHLTIVLLALLLLPTACAGGDEGAGDADVSGDAAPMAQAALGAPCRADSDCIAGLCLASEYGVPFCTRACDTPSETCESGPDTTGAALCISFDVLPNPTAPPFKGELTTFCVPICQTLEQCTALGPAWEGCDKARYLGDELYPALGVSRQVCQAPSFQGKDPVDPVACDWEKTVGATQASEANLCRSYCRYLETCNEIPDATPDACCQWGCFNRMVLEGEIVDAWRDDVKCYVDNHGAFPQQGTANFCSEPPKNCGGTPLDPTPPGSGS